MAQNSTDCLIYFHFIYYNLRRGAVTPGLISTSPDKQTLSCLINHVRHSGTCLALHFTHPWRTAGSYHAPYFLNTAWSDSWHWLNFKPDSQRGTVWEQNLFRHLVMKVCSNKRMIKQCRHFPPCVSSRFVSSTVCSLVVMQQQVVLLKRRLGCLSDWGRMSAWIITWFKYRPSGMRSLGFYHFINFPFGHIGHEIQILCYDWCFI